MHLTQISMVACYYTFHAILNADKLYQKALLTTLEAKTQNVVALAGSAPRRSLQASLGKKTNQEKLENKLKHRSLKKAAKKYRKFILAHQNKVQALHATTKKEKKEKNNLSLSLDSKNKTKENICIRIFRNLYDSLTNRFTKNQDPVKNKGESNILGPENNVDNQKFKNIKSWKTHFNNAQNDNSKRSQEKVFRSTPVIISVPLHQIFPHYPSPGVLPSYDDLRVTPAYLTSYNRRLRVANWVAERLSKVTIHSTRSKKPRRFQCDTAVPVKWRPSDLSIRRSRYFNRGHIAAAANHRHCQNALQSTYLFPTNIMPQNKQNNAGLWNRLETTIRELTLIYNEIYVVSGPLWLPSGVNRISLMNLNQLLFMTTPTSEFFTQIKNQTVLSNHRISYSHLGPQGPAIPSHLFKVIACTGIQESENQLKQRNSKKFSYLLRAFIIPNSFQTNPFWRFRVPYTMVEQYAGLDFSTLKNYVVAGMNSYISEEKKENQYTEFLSHALDSNLKHIYMPLKNEDIILSTNTDNIFTGQNNHQFNKLHYSQSWNYLPSPLSHLKLDSLTLS